MHHLDGFETTLAGKAYLKLIKELKAQGYEVHLYFLWLPYAALVDSWIIWNASLNPPGRVAELAMKQAARKVIEENRRFGEPLIVRENGRVKKIPLN